MKSAASSYDYLEKIFQIPIKLQQISPQNSKQYINSLLAENLDIHLSENNTVTNNTGNASVKAVQGNPGQDRDQIEEGSDICDRFEPMRITEKDMEDWIALYSNGHFF